MNILVTGGAGFIASHIVDAYIENGHSVIVVDDLSSGNRKNINPRAKFYQLDIRSDEMHKIFFENKIDLINHHAAQMDVRRSVNDPKFDASINIVGFLNLMELAHKSNVKKIIFASTGGAIYGEQDYFPADENHPARPLSPYGITKLSTEKYLFYYKEIFGINYVVLRYANVFGPRQNPHGEAGVVAIFSTKFLKNEQPVINGDGKQTRDFVFVGDVVKANVLALKYDKSDIFNIGTGIENDVNTLFKNLKNFTKSNFNEKYATAKLGEQLRSVISNKKAENILGWKPSINFVDGLKQTVEYFQNAQN